ncbi:MAG: helix-turn-helix domain-containing protein [Polyangiaceae bacterium]
MQSSPDWKEWRRLRALALINSGHRAAEVARMVGVTPGAVSQWLKRVREQGGRQGLLRRKAKGRAGRLTGSQVGELVALVRGSRLEPLTSRAICQWIEKHWGIRISRAQICRILTATGNALSVKGAVGLARSSVR